MTTARQAAAYSQSLAAAVQRGLTAGAQSLADVLAFAPGAWPADLQALAPRLTRVRQYAREGQARDPYAFLPVPHPADGEWRFTPDTAAELAASLMHHDRSEVGVVLIGTPTVFLALEHQKRRARLFERSRSVADQLATVARYGEVVVADVTRATLPRDIAGATLVDPPWYPAIMRSFIWAAAHMTVPGGTVLACVPPPLVRPSARDERRSLVRGLGAYRLELIGIQRSRARYATPPFERAALRAAGVVDDLPNWRVGDVLVARRLAGKLEHRPPGPRSDRWTIVGNQGERVAFRDLWGNGDPRLTTLVPGDVLPSVSARDPRHPAIRVWTAMNQVFGCGDPMLAAILAEAVNSGADAGKPATEYLGHDLHADERRWHLTACHQLEALYEVAPTRARQSEGAETELPLP